MNRIVVGQPTLGGNEARYVQDCLQNNRLTMGAYVEAFERRFADYIDTRHAIATCNGTAALHLALAALEIGPGDVVIVPDLTYVATANAVRYTGAIPFLVDVDPHTWNIDINQARHEIIKRDLKPKAIIPVHLYGNPVPMDDLLLLAAEFGMAVIEDAAEALGAEYRGRKAGSWGNMGCFSFYGNKTITTGEGGMITTDSDDLAERLRLLRGQGQSSTRRYWHEVIGFNYRMTDIQGAIGCAQLEQLPRFLERRAAIMDLYTERLGMCFEIQLVSTRSLHGCWAVAVQLPGGVDRDDCMAQMERAGIETRPVFYPLHQMPMYSAALRLFPASTLISSRGIVLPTHADLTNDQVRFISDHLKTIVMEAVA